MPRIVMKSPQDLSSRPVITLIDVSFSVSFPGYRSLRASNQVQKQGLRIVPNFRVEPLCDIGTAKEYSELWLRLLTSR